MDDFLRKRCRHEGLSRNDVHYLSQKNLRYFRWPALVSREMEHERKNNGRLFFGAYGLSLWLEPLSSCKHHVQAWSLSKSWSFGYWLFFEARKKKKKKKQFLSQDILLKSFPRRTNTHQVIQQTIQTSLKRQSYLFCKKEKNLEHDSFPPFSPHHSLRFAQAPWHSPVWGSFALAPLASALGRARGPLEALTAKVFGRPKKGAPLLKKWFFWGG